MFNTVQAKWMRRLRQAAAFISQARRSSAVEEQPKAQVAMCMGTDGFGVAEMCMC